MHRLYGVESVRVKPGSNIYRGIQTWRPQVWMTWRPQGSPLLYDGFRVISVYSSGDPCGRHAPRERLLNSLVTPLVGSLRALRGLGGGVYDGDGGDSYLAFGCTGEAASPGFLRYMQVTQEAYKEIDCDQQAKH